MTTLQALYWLRMRRNGRDRNAFWALRDLPETFSFAGVSAANEEKSDFLSVLGVSSAAGGEGVGSVRVMYQIRNATYSVHSLLTRAETVTDTNHEHASRHREMRAFSLIDLLASIGLID